MDHLALLNPLSAVRCVTPNGVCGMRFFSAQLMGVFIHLCLGNDYTHKLRVRQERVGIYSMLAAPWKLPVCML